MPGQDIVANVNIDMFLPLFPLKSLMVLGLDESDLGDEVRAVARSWGLACGRSQPQRNRFIRSDQVQLHPAGHPGTGDEGRLRARFARGEDRRRMDAPRYHAPSDDLEQPIDRGAAAGYTDLIGRLSVRVANRDEPSPLAGHELLQALRDSRRHRRHRRGSLVEQPRR